MKSKTPRKTTPEEGHALYQHSFTLPLQIQALVGKTLDLGHTAVMLLHEKAVCMLKDSSWEYDKFIHFHPENKSVILGRKLSCFQSLLCVFAGIFFRLCFLIVWCSFLGCDSLTFKGLIICPRPTSKQLWPLLLLIDVSVYHLSDQVLILRT